MTHPHEANRAAALAAEQRFNLGVPDVSLACELADYAEEAEQATEDEFWEREGRREMYATLFDGCEGAH